MFQRTIPRGGYGGQSRSSGRNSRRKRRIPTESANWQLFPTPCDVAHTLHAYAYASLLRKFLNSRDNAVAPADPWHKTGSHVHRYIHICISETGHRSTTPAFLPRGKNYSCPFVFLFFVSNSFGARTTLVNRTAASVETAPRENWWTRGERDRCGGTNVRDPR